MDPLSIIFSYLTLSIVAGLAGACAMVIFSFALAQLVKVSIITAVGSTISGDLKHALKPGLVLHSATGVAFGFAYVLFFLFMNPSPLSFLLLIGAMAGLLHGIAVSLLLVGSLGDNSELEYIRRKAFQIGFITVGAHVVYGFIVGLMTMLWGSPIFDLL